MPANYGDQIDPKDLKLLVELPLRERRQARQGRLTGAGLGRPRGGRPSGFAQAGSSIVGLAERLTAANRPTFQTPKPTAIERQDAPSVRADQDRPRRSRSRGGDDHRPGSGTRPARTGTDCAGLLIGHRLIFAGAGPPGPARSPARADRLRRCDSLAFLIACAAGLGLGLLGEPAADRPRARPRCCSIRSATGAS